VNSRRENEILSTAFEGHDGTLIDSGYFKISDFRLYYVVGVGLVERIHSLELVEVSQDVVPRTIY